jgi:hypothetical protein
MKISKIVSSLVLASIVVSVSPTFSMAKGDYELYFDAEKSQGQLGAIISNPYEMAPQTAIIGLNGKEIKDVSVSIEPKNGGTALSYKVPQQANFILIQLLHFQVSIEQTTQLHILQLNHQKSLKIDYIL